MARGRMISATLGRSEKWNRLDHFAKLVYVLALTHADAEGRIVADAIDIYADSFVRDPEANPDRIESSLIDLDKVGLIELYEIGGKRYAIFVGFHEHNTIRRREDGSPLREAASKLPPPQSDSAGTAQSVRSNRAVAQHEVEVEVEVEVEEKPGAPETKADEDMKALRRLQKKDREAHKIVETLGGQLRWQFRHKNLAAGEVLRRGQPAIDALAETLKGADRTGAPAYRYFEAILEGRSSKLAKKAERDYKPTSSADLLDQADAKLVGRWS